MVGDAESRPLGDLCSFINRGSAPAYVDQGGALVINQRCIRNHRVDYGFARRTDQNRKPIASERWLQPNDIVVNSTGVGTLGRVAQVRALPDRATVDSHVTIVRPDPKEVDPAFLGYCIRYREAEIENLAEGSTGQTELSRSNLAALEVNLPDARTQQAIGAIGSALDDKIDLNRRMAATLEDMARALFKSWFVDFDPVHAKAEGRDTGLPADIAALFPDGFDDERLPVGWRNGSIDDLANTNSESWKASSHPEEIEYVDLSNCKWGKIDETTTYRWDDAPSRARRVAYAGDTIFGTVRPGNGSYAFIGREGLTVSTGFAVLRPKKVIYREIVYLAATTIDNIRWLEQLAAGHGGAYPAVNPDKVSATAVNIASEKVIEAFSANTANMIDRIETLKQECADLEQLRDALLPKLLSGELRVDDAADSIAAA